MLTPLQCVLILVLELMLGVDVYLRLVVEITSPMARCSANVHCYLPYFLSGPRLRFFDFPDRGESARAVFPSSVFLFLLLSLARLAKPPITRLMFVS